MNDENDVGFSLLFSKLCEISFNQEAHRSCDIYWRPRYNNLRRKALKLCLYETLFEELRAPWVGELTRARQKSSKDADEGSPFSVKDKLSIAAFKLRHARRFDEADRLDELVRQWSDLEEPSSGVVDFASTKRKTVFNLENEAVLRFLVALSGTVSDDSTEILGHQKDLWSNAPRQIYKTSLPQGPLLITDSQLLRHRALELGRYVHYSRELFECPPVVSEPECATKEKIQDSTFQIFEALPGTFPGKAKFFSRQDDSEDIFEKKARTSLFSALVHSRTDDMQVKLSLPHLPSDANTLHSLATEQREIADDEGFESLETSSNSSLSSDLGLVSNDNIDIWSAALKLPSQKFYTWEMEGRRDMLDERPYLSEAGAAVFDALYDTVIRQVSYLVKAPSLSRDMVSMVTLIKDAINVLIGVPSKTFLLDKVTLSFHVSRQVRLSGISPEMLGNILARLAAMGTDYIQLNKFATHHRGQTAGLVLQAFLGALQNYLQCYRATVLSVDASSVQSPLQLAFAFEKSGRQLRFLANMCMCSQAFKKAPADPKVKFPTGVKLLTYLYQLCLEHSSSTFYPILLSLLRHSVMPYITFVQTWVFKGVCNDLFGEFMIEMDEQYLAYRDKHFWTQGYVIIGRDKLDCVPLFLGELADDIFVCGKTINLLKLCCPEHFLCDPGVRVPTMEVTFSMRRLSKIEEECKQYKDRIQQMHNRLKEKKENERRAIEDEKQRAIHEERKRTEKALAEITELIQEAKNAVELKKREDLKRLKEQMEEAFKHKALAKKEEQEADAKYLQEAKDREVTTASVEDELKRKAREDLIKYYDELTREVEYREFRAQWRIRRTELDTARVQFLAQEQARLDSVTEQLAQRSGTQETSTQIPLASSQPGQVAHEEPSPGYGGENGPSTVSVASPSLVSLIASGVHTDALLRSEQLKNLGRSADLVSEEATEEASGVSREGNGAPSGASSDTVAVVMKTRKTWEAPEESVAQLGNLKEKNSGRKTWETPQSDIKIASPLPKSHPSDSSVQFALYGEKRKSSDEGETPERIHDVTSQTRTPQVSDSSLQNILYPSSSSVEESGQDTQPSNFVNQASQPCLGSMIKGHPSDSSTQELLYGGVSIPSSTMVGTPPAHGHPSDSSAQHLLYSSNPLDGDDIETRCSSEHGHPSDSSVSSLLYPVTVDAQIPRNPHGHPSDSQVSLFHDNSKGRILPPSTRSTWQHPSDASVQKLLSDINILGESVQPTRGTPPPSVSQDILYPRFDTHSTSLPSGTRGTPPQSVAQDILYPRGEESGKTLIARHTRGAPPSSVIQDIMYPTGDGSGGEGSRMSTRGHEPEVKITKVMYYGRDKEEKTVVEQEQKQLVFEDVWLASEVEPLQDNFAILDEKPSSDLLQSVLVGFQTSQGSDDEDTDAAQLMSLPVLLQRSVMAPVLAQVSLVNSAIVAYFLDDLQISKHFNLFKKLLFMEDGEFSLSLSNQLFEKLVSGISPPEMCSATVLNGIVGKAIQSSVYSDITAHAQHLAFALKTLPGIFKQNEMGALDFLELRYAVEWPVNIVITEKSIAKYNKIFSFMLRLKRLSWVLRDIWFHLKHIACSRDAAMSPQLRQLQLFRHEMQHFVHNLEGYLSNQILNVTWSEFQEGLVNVSSLDDLHNQHAEYLRKAIFRSLLNRKAAPVMTIISDMGKLILKLRTQLLASPWQQDPDTGHVTHPTFDVMCNTHKAFKEYSRFLFTVVSKLVQRGYQSHWADFLLRINFNHFYVVDLDTREMGTLPPQE
ncbi:gamma-tubulin complex component 6-like isoform X2 [Montipora capricornis]|uniref:gamma-tubulin complex component 6-like isoform X2 n=1 Tax=Montipora capricornis TaxID=246305 RepID=UPI0035F1E8EE